MKAVYAGTGTLTPARCGSPGFWTLFFFEIEKGVFWWTRSRC